MEVGFRAVKIRPRQEKNSPPRHKTVVMKRLKPPQFPLYFLRERVIGMLADQLGPGLLRAGHVALGL
jgi:hypothetical protein